MSVVDKDNTVTVSSSASARELIKMYISVVCAIEDICASELKFWITLFQLSVLFSLSQCSRVRGPFNLYHRSMQLLMRKNCTTP
jgi:hypothetical protein